MLQAPAQITFTAHQTHWYDILRIVMLAVANENPIIATLVPAPIEAGIQIAIAEAPVIAGIGQALDAANAPSVFAASTTATK
jgi:hypothetical protein